MNEILERRKLEKTAAATPEEDFPAEESEAESEPETEEDTEE
jgi:hypothetical protein